MLDSNEQLEGTGEFLGEHLRFFRQAACAAPVRDLRGFATGLTITAVAHGISGRFLTLHPTNRHVAQQKRKNCEEPRANTAKDRTGFSVMFRPRVAIRFGTLCPGRPPK